MNLCVLSVDCADNAHGFVSPLPYLYFERSMTEFLFTAKAQRSQRKYSMKLMSSLRHCGE
jgi:hypothetical protein